MHSRSGGRWTGHAEAPNLFAGARYGYGLFVQPWNGVETLWHPGTAPGFSAMIRMVPARNAAVVVLVNRDGVRLERVIDTALAVLVTTSVPTAAASASSATRDTASLPTGADEMRRVAGTYANRWPVELAVVGDRLVLRRFGAELPVRRISRDRFSAAVPGTTRTEELVIGPPGADGRPLWLHMFLWAFARRE